MLRLIQGMLGVTPRQERPVEHEQILRETKEARQKYTAARAYYDGLMESVVWTEEQERRIELAYTEIKAAEERLALMTAFARGAGVTATWEDVVAV